MQIQFFPSIKEFWENLIERDWSLWIFDLPDGTSQETHEFSLSKKWKLQSKSIDRIESNDSKKARILSLLVSSEDYQSVDSEWVFLEYSDIWPAIIARFFKSDPNAEMAYLQKWNFLTSLPERTEEQQNELDLIKQWYVSKEEFKDFLLTLIIK